MRREVMPWFAVVVWIAILSWFAPQSVYAQSGTEPNSPLGNKTDGETKIATLGGGCFWCLEAVYERVHGVKSVVSGYAGGRVPNPTYEQVCTGLTGHIEVCQIEYDPTVVSYDELLSIFWKIHDPTSRDKQGEDEGEQYRSIIFYSDDEQRETAEEYIQKMNKDRVFRRDVVTKVEPLKAFYRAEEKHQDYFAKHPEQAYCQNVIAPKVGKFEKIFKENSKLQIEKAKRAKEKKGNKK